MQPGPRDLENRVGFLPRAGAYLLDLAATWTIALALQSFLIGLFPNVVATLVAEKLALQPELGEMRAMLEWGARLNVATRLVAPIYGLIEAFRGFSPGKLVLGLRVVSESGQRAPIGTLLVRYAIKNGGLVVGAVGLMTAWKPLGVLSDAMQAATFVGFLLVLDRARMAIHDRVAGTAVLRKTDVVVPAAVPARKPTEDKLGA
jgi:uncharacterized RDD family membrane protein YckC